MYGSTHHSKPVDEQTSPNPVSPYGRSKLFAEKIIEDFSSAYGLSTLSLRYFNVAGNSRISAYDLSPHNLFPNLYKSICNSELFYIYGNEYNTPDGSCIRDYVDVRLLSGAHVKSLKKMLAGEALPKALNLGSGKGFSVLEIVETARRVISDNLTYYIADPRDGDPAAILADVTMAQELINWDHSSNLEEILISGYEAWLRSHEN